MTLSVSKSSSWIEMMNERKRCIKIVRAYREELILAYTKRPDAPNAKQVFRLIERLAKMELEMRQGPGEVAKAKKQTETYLDGDFTEQEMEQAKAIIAEQINPFE